MPNSEYATERRRVPRPMIVSWFIDGVLAVGLFSAVYAGGTFIERLNTVVENIDRLATRVTQLESRPVGPGGETRIAVLEANDAHQDLMIDALKGDITSRLDRLETKMDRMLTQ